MLCPLVHGESLTSYSGVSFSVISHKNFVTRHGTGRKAKKSFLSPVLLAVYDEDEDVYRSISRCMTFTDAMYEAMREFYFRGIPYPSDLEAGDNEEISVKKEDASMEFDEEAFMSTEKWAADTEELTNCFPTRPSSAFVITNEQPTFWFKPLEVFEVSFADMTLSRQHTAAAGLVPDSEGRGVALRFPRFKRRRPDKRPDQATTTAEIAAMFANQTKQGSSFSKGKRM
jgi:DNA ligase-1